MCQPTPHICSRTQQFLSLSDKDKWIGEEDATRKIKGTTPSSHAVSVSTSVPSIIAFCHKPPYCYTMMTVREYYYQSWLPGVP